MASSREEKIGDFRPLNNYVSPMLTDLYQISMAYAYWSTGRSDDFSVFDLFFRKNPFKGEYTIFAGLEDCLRVINAFEFTEEDIAKLKKKLPKWKPGFWDYLRSLDCSEVKVYAIKEGSVVFPREPLMRLEGPLGVCQLLETTLLNCTNYASLVCTNAARHRVAAGASKRLLEFGLRRAQGPDGAMSAAKYAYMGGFDGTSNVQASTTFDMPMKGTHAHSFVVSYASLSELKERTIVKSDGKTTVNFVDLCLAKRSELSKAGLGRVLTNEGELSAFIAYAQAYPEGLLALIDTYDTLGSGLTNFLAVALALHDCGYKAIGVRLDSGDLAYLSKKCRARFRKVGEVFDVPYFGDFTIVASNDINEKVLYALNEQKHEIDTFGIGTHLVTCYQQPALGCVYKLVEVNNKPRIKISQEIAKVTIPGRKSLYRLFNKNDEPMMDLLTTHGQQPPTAHNRVLCRHPFAASKRAYVTPSRVEELLVLVWDGRLTVPVPTLEERRRFAHEQLALIREDHKRVMNPTPYKLSVTSDLFSFMHDLWMRESPIAEIE